MSSRHRSTRHTNSPRLLRTEHLEDRRLLAVTPELIDINLDGDGSDPREMTVVGDIVYFMATGPNHRQSLWRSDGAGAGTYQLREFLDWEADQSFELTNVNGVLYFTASGSNVGRELWKSDGTVAGTTLVKDIRLFTGPSDIDHLVNVDGILYFSANDGIYGNELWKSDGTADGTVLVKDITPGPESSYPSELTAVGSSLFFSAKSESSSQTLWRSQGTAASTVALAGSTPEHLVNVSGTLYFKADDVGMPDQLFKSDGTVAGTMRAAAITVGDNLTNMNGVVYFDAVPSEGVTEVWRTDGTIAGTIRLAAFPTNGWVKSVRELTVAGDTLYFVGVGQFSSIVGLWKSDGTQAGTMSVFNEQLPLWFSQIDGLTNVDGTLYFRGGNHLGRELWKVDGSANGAAFVKDVNPSGDGLSVAEFQRVSLGGSLYFAADDGASGLEFWKSDGSAPGTTLVASLPPTSLGSSPREFIQVNDRWYFLADAGGNLTEIWTTDGAQGGTRPLFSNPEIAKWPRNLFHANGFLYFYAYGDSGESLWRTDGTETGTVAIPGTGRLEFRYATFANGVVYFSSNDPDYPVHNYGSELWKFDLVTETATRLTDINPGQWSSQPRNLTSHNGAIYFAANDGAHGFELWKHDGASATLVKDIHPGAAASVTNSGSSEPFPIVNGAMLFLANSPGSGHELWRSDGTEAGTFLLKDIYPGINGSTQALQDSTFEIVGDTMYFWAYEPTRGQELWRSDGTVAGTFRVKDIRPGSGNSTPRGFANLNGTLYFTANDGTHGYQLWKSDGTEAGTLMVADAFNGEFLSSYLRNIDGTLMFVANDGVHGSEIWTSDGTAEGTRMLLDFTPGPKSTSVSEFLNINGIPFVTLDDGQTGYELWRFAEDRSGDFNRDGVVNGNDFLAWQRAYGSTVVAGSGADGDGDGLVGASDLQLWKNAFDEPAAGVGVPPVATVAESSVAASEQLVAVEADVTSYSDGLDDVVGDLPVVAEPASSAITSRRDVRDALFAAGDFSRYGVESGGGVETLQGRRRWSWGRRR